MESSQGVTTENGDMFPLISIVVSLYISYGTATAFTVSVSIVAAVITGVGVVSVVVVGIRRIGGKRADIEQTLLQQQKQACDNTPEIGANKKPLQSESEQFHRYVRYIVAPQLYIVCIYTWYTPSEERVKCQPSQVLYKQQQAEQELTRRDSVSEKSYLETVCVIVRHTERRREGEKEQKEREKQRE